MEPGQKIVIQPLVKGILNVLPHVTLVPIQIQFTFSQRGLSKELRAIHESPRPCRHQAIHGCLSPSLRDAHCGSANIYPLQTVF